MTNISKQNAVNNIYSDLYKQVRCASTANVTIATDLNAGDTIDGITLAAGDLVLLKNQTAGAENGIYVVSASPARWVNYNTDAAIRGSKVLVKEGTANVGTVFANTNTDAITMESTSITYQRAFRETILADKTITVKTAGGDFADPILAYNSLAAYEIAATATVTIEINDGTYTNTSSWNMTHPNGDRIVVTGKNYYTKTINSIQSAGARTQEGSTGAYYTDYVLNMNTVTNIAANDWVFICETSGGTNPLLIQGCSEVQSVDNGNTRITVRVYSNSSTQASGNVTTTKCYVIKTMLQFNGVTGISLNKTMLGSIQKLQIIGNRTTGTSGLSCTAGKVQCGDAVVQNYWNAIGIAKFGTSLYAAIDGGVIIATNCMASSTAGNGFDSNRWSYVSLSYGSTNDCSAGFVASSNSVTLCSENTKGSHYGHRSTGTSASLGGLCIAFSTTMIYNTAYGALAQTCGIVRCSSSIVQNNGTTDVIALTGGYVVAASTTYGTVSPVIDTIGTKNQFVSST